MDKLFRYSFLNSPTLPTQYYYVDSNGNVLKSNTPEYLHDDPDGWEQMQVSFDRNEEQGGIFRRSTVPLKFHSDAAKILRTIFYNYHLKGYCKLVVEKQNRDFGTNNWNYDLWYSCEIDFGTSVDGAIENEPGEVYFTARLIELGVVALMEANDSTPYEIPLYTNGVLDADAKGVEISDIHLNAKYEWMLPETKDYVTGVPYTISNGFGPNALDVFFLTSDSIIDLGTGGVSFNQETSNAGSVVFESMFNFIGTFRARNSFTFKVDAGNTGNLRFKVSLYQVDKANVSTQYDLFFDPNTAGTAPGVTVTLSFDVTLAPITILEGDRFFVRVEPVLISGSTFLWEYGMLEDGDFTLDAEFILPATTMHGFRYIDLAKKLISRMTSGAGTAVSTLLTNSLMTWFNSRPYNCIVVPGASIRGLENPVIKTSWSELRQDLRTMYGAGFGIEGNNVRIEPKSYFYQKDTSLAVLEFNGPLKKSFATDFAYGKYRVGFADSGVDEINGLQEFCCEHVYSSGFISPAASGKEMNLVSPYIHGMYSIENIRAYRFRTDSTSTTKDNEVCVIEVGDTANVVINNVSYYSPRKGVIPSSLGNTVVGLLFPNDAYNLGHSPKTCLIRNLNEIRSWHTTGDVITFQTATKNAAVEYGNLLNTGNYIIERADIEITSTGAKVSGSYSVIPNYTPIPRTYLPFIIEANGQLPFNLLTRMDGLSGGVYMKYGTITLVNGNTSIKVFNLDCGITPGTEDAYMIRGLLVPDADINDLIQ